MKRLKIHFPSGIWLFLQWANNYTLFVKEPGRLAPLHIDRGGMPLLHSLMPKFYDITGEMRVTQNNLPHWDQGDTWIFLTWRLADSLPQPLLVEWKFERAEFDKKHPKPWDDDAASLHRETFTDRQEEWLDKGFGSCALKDLRVRQIVSDAFHFFDEDRYELGSYVVMPNHVHLLMSIKEGYELSQILHSWKSYTSKKINKLLDREGTFWMEDYHDRLIRSQRHLYWAQMYILNNQKHLKQGSYTLFVKE